MIACGLFTILFVTLPSLQNGGHSEVEQLLGPNAAADSRCKEIFSRIDGTQHAQLRFAAVREIVSLGEAATPCLEKMAEGGHRERQRVAWFVLAELGSEEGEKFLQRLFSSKKDFELDALSLLLGGKIGGEKSRDRCFQTLHSRIADPYLRCCAALALCLLDPSMLEGVNADFRAELSPEVAGPLAIAMEKNAGEKSISSLKQRLSVAKEPVLRAGLWLALASAGGDSPIELAIQDLESEDQALAYCAALNFLEIPPPPWKERWERVYRKANPLLKSCMIEGLGRGSGFSAKKFIYDVSQEERDPEVRKAVLRAALRRHDLALAYTIQKNRAGESLGGLWAATMALLLLEGQSTPLSDSNASLIRDLASGLGNPKEECPEGILLWLAVAGGREEESFLREVEASNAALSDTARMARKYLRGEVDPRTLKEETLKIVRAKKLLPGHCSRRLQTLYAELLLGAGSRAFEAKPEFPSASLWTAEERKRPRPIPIDSTFFDDLWYWLESGVFEF